MSLGRIFGILLWLAALYFGFVTALAVQMHRMMDSPPPGWNWGSFLGPVTICLPFGALLSGLAAFAQPQYDKIGAFCFSVPVAMGVIASLREAQWAAAGAELVCIGGVFWAAVLSARLNRMEEAGY